MGKGIVKIIRREIDTALVTSIQIHNHSHQHRHCENNIDRHSQSYWHNHRFTHSHGHHRRHSHGHSHKHIGTVIGTVGWATKLQKSKFCVWYLSLGCIIVNYTNIDQKSLSKTWFDQNWEYCTYFCFGRKYKGFSEFIKGKNFRHFFHFLILLLATLGYGGHQR